MLQAERLSEHIPGIHCFALYCSCVLSPQNCRVAKQLTVSIRMLGDQRASGLSRCCALPRYDAHKISSDAFMIIRNCNVAGAQQAAW